MQLIPCPPHPKLLVEHDVELAVELRGEGAMVHHGKVVGVDPILFASQLLFDRLIEFGAG